MEPDTVYMNWRISMAVSGNNDFFFLNAMQNSSNSKTDIAPL